MNPGMAECTLKGIGRGCHLVLHPVAAADVLDGRRQLGGVQAGVAQQLAPKARVVQHGQHQVLHAGEVVLPLLLDVLRLGDGALQVAAQHLQALASCSTPMLHAQDASWLTCPSL